VHHQNCAVLLCPFLLLQFNTLRTVSFFADVVIVVVVVAVAAAAAAAVAAADRCESISKKIGGKGAAEGLK